MDKNRYLLKHTDEIITPCLIYYKDIIEQNIKEMISVAGNANRLWPHVKSHKMKKLVELQIKMGITRFKCATIAEAQMVAESGASDALVAYPLVGPNIDRFLELVKTYAGTRFWAIGDDLEQVSLLNSAAGSQETIVNFWPMLTWVPTELEFLSIHCQIFTGTAVNFPGSLSKDFTAMTVTTELLNTMPEKRL